MSLYLAECSPTKYFETAVLLVVVSCIWLPIPLCTSLSLGLSLSLSLACVPFFVPVWLSLHQGSLSKFTFLHTLTLGNNRIDDLQVQSKKTNLLAGMEM